MPPSLARAPRERQLPVEENHLTQVASVTLEVGEVSGIIPYYLTDEIIRNQFIEDEN